MLLILPRRYLIFLCIGSGSATEILGIFFSTTDPGQHPSDAHCPTDPREAYNGRLCRQTDQGQGRYGHNRPPEAHAGCFSEPMPPDEGDPGG